MDELTKRDIAEGYFQRLNGIAHMIQEQGYSELSTKFEKGELPVEVCYYCTEKLGDQYYVFREKGVVFAISQDCIDYLVKNTEEALKNRIKSFEQFMLIKKR